MASWFEEQKAKLTAAASKFANKETAEAIVAIMVGTAYADGEKEPAEVEKIKKAFTVNAVLKQFPNSALVSKFNELGEQLEFDVPAGHTACLKELDDMKRKPEEQRIAVMQIGMAIARSDKTLEPAEETWLRRCATTLDVAPERVGL